MWDLINTYIKAFWSKILKNLAFSISKTNFITYNTSLYNISYIKTSIFFLTLHLNILSLLFFILPLSLTQSLSFSTHRHHQQTHQAKNTHTHNKHIKQKNTHSKPTSQSTIVNQTTKQSTHTHNENPQQQQQTHHGNPPLSIYCSTHHSNPSTQIQPTTSNPPWQTSTKASPSH